MRLDVALVARGLARSRNQAATLISQGKVFVQGLQAQKASQIIQDKTQLDVVGDLYVARSAAKLADALDHFGVEVPHICLDAGASTGGFTQVLLERGAELVLAVDVGHDQLAEELRTDSRVRNLEGQNIRELTPKQLGVDQDQITLVVADLSFISLTLVAKKFADLAPKAKVITLIKPQFELDRTRLNKLGVVSDRNDRLRAVQSVITEFESAGYTVSGFVSASVIGATGNQEYLAFFERGAGKSLELSAIAEQV